MPEQIYEFNGKIEKYDFGKFFYTVVYLPDEIATKLPFGKHQRLRVEAEIDLIFIEGAWMPDKGRWYLMTPRKLLKALGKKQGDSVSIRFRVVDQDTVNIPDELHRLLVQNEELKAKWDKLTSGKRRGLAYRISQAKTQPTIEKRLYELSEYLESLD